MSNNLGSEDLNTNDFQQPVPFDFRFKENPNAALMAEVKAAITTLRTTTITALRLSRRPMGDGI